jgi:DNA-binding NarL/FixJ family response regulator
LSIRLLIADDHPVVLQGLVALLAVEPDIEVSGAFRDGVELMEAIALLRPDLVLLDNRMPELGGIAVLEQLATLEPPPHCILLAGTLSDAEVLDAVRLGVRGIILKAEAPAQLVEAIRAVARGERRVDVGLLDQALSALHGQPGRGRDGVTLTRSETRIVHLVCRGLPNKLIARELGIREAAVRTHLHQIFRKVQVRNRVQLTMHARQNGLVTT